MAGETLVTLIGNLTADPELRYTQNQLAVVNFTIATTERTFDKETREPKDGDAMFTRCTIWRELAEHVAATLHKGDRVIAQGRLKQRKWEDKEGNQRVSTEVDVDAIGPELRWAQASVTRITRATGSTDNPAYVQSAGSTGWAPDNTGYTDETPF